MTSSYGIPRTLWWTAPPLAWSLAWAGAFAERRAGAGALPVSEKVQEEHAVPLEDMR